MSWVTVPMPPRPATPWMHSFPERPRYWGQDEYEFGGMGDIDPSQITDDITGVFRTIYSNEPGMYTETLPDGTVRTYRQPTGSTSSLPVGYVGSNLNTSVQGNITSGAGVWILLAAGVLLLVMFRGKR